jgi:hypothetical protein
VTIRRPIANIIVWLYRGGQVHALSLVQEILEDLGWQVRLVVTSRQSPHAGVRADVNLYSSEIHPAWLRMAHANVLIANAEQDVRQSSTSWLRPERFGEVADQLRYLRLVDEVWAQTREGFGAFAARGLPAGHVGFTARDQYCPEVAKDDAAGWLCLVGDNFGTRTCRRCCASGHRTRTSLG